MRHSTGRLPGDANALAANRFLSCLHTSRDLGNRIHADSVVAPADVALAHHSNKRLLEAVLRVGPLDQD